MNVTNAELNEVLQSQILEIDPTGRYVKYNEILGRGPSRTMYKGFDEYEGIEIAWNQIKIDEFQETEEDIERLYSEIDELMELNHKNIMKLYASWIDSTNKNINFVTEMFTSGTLREFRQKHKRVNIRAVKNWCRQILGGLVYLHSQEPPIVHRNLGCDNIFINGNQGEVKIGDLGLASILYKSHAGQCIEFMAPKVDQEEHNELVDIYAFGICVLEMVTFEYPDDSEFAYSAQIYRRLVSGKKLDALYKVKNLEVQRFIEKCLAVESDRFSAHELLMDPFLEISDEKPASEFHHECNYESYYIDNDPYCKTPDYVEPIKLDLPRSHDDDEIQENGDITIKGTRGDDDGIFLVIRMPDKEGGARNIYFPFNIESDTAFSVATEMVSELEMNEEDVTKISNMIDAEIVSLLMENVANFDLNEEYEKEIMPTNNSSTKNRRLEFRWLKTKYEMQLKEPRDENSESRLEILGF